MTSPAYYTLLGSLPALPRHFEQADREPISWYQLQQRLEMLEPPDAEVLEQLARFLAWERQPLERTDEEVCRRYEVLRGQLKNPTAWGVVAFRMRVRTIMSALRRRRRRLGPPPGVGSLARHIARHWDSPTLRLEVRYPWIVEAERLLAEARPRELEELLLRISWKCWTRLSDEQTFSFDAVILYVARWSVLSRWLSRDAAAGREKFAMLVTEAMGEQTGINF